MGQGRGGGGGGEGEEEEERGKAVRRVRWRGTVGLEGRNGRYHHPSHQFQSPHLCTHRVIRGLLKRSAPPARFEITSGLMREKFFKHDVRVKKADRESKL